MHEESSARMVVYIYWLDPTSHLSSPPPSMTASSSCSILSRFPQTKYDKFDNATTFANPLSQFPPVNPLSPQGFNCSVPGSMECASGYDGFQPHHSNNAGLSSSQLQSNMHGLFNPSVPSSEGSFGWFDGDYNSVLEYSANPLRAFNPFNPSLSDGHGFDVQAYHPGYKLPNDLKPSLPESSFSTQNSGFTTTQHDSPHTIQRLPSTEVRLVDSFLGRQNISGRQKWVCLFTGCQSSGSWRNKDAARSHVYKHLNETKLFKCVKCDVSFASEKNAIRHCAYQGRSFPCGNCSSVFTRIDYRNKHQKSCASRL